MFDIGAFSTYINNTGTLPVNRFQVTIPTPRILLNANIQKMGSKLDINSITKNDIVMRAESVRVPGIAINTSQVNRYGIGPIQKFPNNGNFTDTSMTFLCDRDSIMWVFFYHWLNGVFAFDEENPDNSNGTDVNTYRTNYKEDYISNIDIDVYNYNSASNNDMGSVSSSFRLYDAFPTSMNDVNLDWGTTNNTVKLTITFAFTDWVFLNTSRKTFPPRQAIAPKTSLPPKAQTVQSVNQIAPDPAQNSGDNPFGRYNNPTVPGGTNTPTFINGA
jgi:hypothetical protein